MWFKLLIAFVGVFGVWFVLGIIGWGLFYGHDSMYSIFPMSRRVKMECILICMAGGLWALIEGFKENPFKYGFRIW